jgi:hypothetical protein
MKHILGILTQLITMIVSYLTVGIVIIFDALIFAYPILLIYNFVLVTNFGTPELNYVDFVGLIFLFKLIAVLWKSVHMDAPLIEDQLTEDNNE